MRAAGSAAIPHVARGLQISEWGSCAARLAVATVTAGGVEWREIFGDWAALAPTAVAVFQVQQG